jgi:hypothetical protein
MNRLNSLSWQLDEDIGVFILGLDPLELGFGGLRLGAS